MKLCLQVLGERLLARVTRELARPDSAFPRQFGVGVPLQWQIERLAQQAALPSVITSSAVSGAGGVVVALVEAQDAVTVDQLWSLASREYHAMAGSDANACRPPPVIVVFDRELPTSRLLDLPAIVSDWVSGSDAMHDLARRILFVLKQRHLLVPEPDSARLSIAVAQRRLQYGDKFTVLTPHEVSLAELFLARFGSVIPMEELQLMFRLAGRSVEGSNMRVTMFQLRFKIEALTRGHYTLSCAYGLGYVLRHGKTVGASVSASARTSPNTGSPQRNCQETRAWAASASARAEAASLVTGAA